MWISLSDCCRGAAGPVALFALACVAASCICASEQNLLKNPSFERVAESTGYPLHWAPVWGRPTSCAYTLACAKHGIASALITDSRDDESHGLRSVHTKVVPGRWYEASVFVRIAECTQGGFALYLEFWNQAKVRGEHKIVTASEQEPLQDWDSLKSRCV